MQKNFYELRLMRPQEVIPNHLDDLEALSEEEIQWWWDAKFTAIQRIILKLLIDLNIDMDKYPKCKSIFKERA